jgi:hypothetical protein
LFQNGVSPLPEGLNILYRCHKSPLFKIRKITRDVRFNKEKSIIISDLYRVMKKRKVIMSDVEDYLVWICSGGEVRWDWVG